MDEKTTLLRYLREQRAGLLGKLDGLGEYDARRPLTPTGTNLAGLVKHVASVQLDYLGVVFDRPSVRSLPWLADDAEPEADLWVPADQTLAEVRELHAFSAAHADATVGALPLDATGRVPWWSERSATVTLHQVLVHLVAETARHAGHADILREQLDDARAGGLTGGSLGNGPQDPNVPDRDAAAWAAHRARVEAGAREAAEG